MTWHEIPPPPPPPKKSMLDPVLGYSGRARKKHLFQIRRCFLTLNILSGSLPHCLPPCLNNLWLVSLPAQMRRRTHIFRCKGRNPLKINVPPAPSYHIRRFNIITPTPEWWMRNEWHEMNQEMQGILIIVIFDLWSLIIIKNYNETKNIGMSQSRSVPAHWLTGWIIPLVSRRFIQSLWDSSSEGAVDWTPAVHIEGTQCLSHVT